MNLLKEILQVFYPSTCLICETHLNSNENLICFSCENQLPYTEFSRLEQNPFEKKLQGRLHIQAATSSLYFRKNNVTQKLIHHLKYKGLQQVGTYLAKKLGREMQASNRFNRVEGIVMVPLDQKKLKIRGYNQLTEFSKQLGKELNIPVFDNVLIKNNFTESQTHKNKNERFESLNHFFETVNLDQIKNKHILLVDDVITTGATLEQCVSELSKVENIKISLATMAYSEN